MPDVSPPPHSPVPPSQPWAPAGAEAHPVASLALWLALALAFSPVLVDLATHLLATRWARYTVVFAPLAALALWREGRGPGRTLGLVGVAAGLALEVVAGFLGAIRWARPGLLLAVLGLCQHQGLGSWRARSLCAFAIPAPAFLVRLGSGPVAYAMTDLVAAAWRGLGLAVEVRRGVVHGASGALVVPDHDWLYLAPLLAGLAWYDGVRLGRAVGPSLLGTLAAAALALPIQTVALFAAVGLAAAGGTGPAQVLVDRGTWIAIAVAAVAATELRAYRRWSRS